MLPEEEIFTDENGVFDEDLWIEAWPDFPCPNCGMGGVPKGVSCLQCGCEGIVEKTY